MTSHFGTLLNECSPAAAILESEKTLGTRLYGERVRGGLDEPTGSPSSKYEHRRASASIGIVAHVDTIGKQREQETVSHPECE